MDTRIPASLPLFLQFEINRTFFFFCSITFIRHEALLHRTRGAIITDDNGKVHEYGRGPLNSAERRACAVCLLMPRDAMHERLP